VLESIIDLEKPAHAGYTLEIILNSQNIVRGRAIRTSCAL
jgi:hypothetical protein